MWIDSNYCVVRPSRQKFNWGPWQHTPKSQPCCPHDLKPAWCTRKLRSRPGKPNQKKGQNEKFMNFAHFCEFWCFPWENKHDSPWTCVPECPPEKFMNWPFFGLVCRGHSWETLHDQYVESVFGPPQRTDALMRFPNTIPTQLQDILHTFWVFPLRFAPGFQEQPKRAPKPHFPWRSSEENLLCLDEITTPITCLNGHFGSDSLERLPSQLKLKSNQDLHSKNRKPNGSQGKVAMNCCICWYSPSHFDSGSA